MVRCFWILLNYLCQLIELLCMGRKLKYDSVLQFLNALMSASVIFYSVVLAVPWSS